jgi:hypothetical protein
VSHFIVRPYGPLCPEGFGSKVPLQPYLKGLPKSLWNHYRVRPVYSNPQPRAA